MKHILLAVLGCTLASSLVAKANVTSPSRDLVILQSQDLPESTRSTGQSMTIRTWSNGTYLYLEQEMGAKLAILDVTDPSRIRSVGTVVLDSSSAFDFVKDLDDTTSLICFRNNKGAAIVDFRKPKQPKVVVIEALRQAGQAEAIGGTGLLMVAQSRHAGDTPVVDYQVVDTSNPRRPQLLVTVVQVQQKLYDPATGATYLLGASGLTVIRQPRVEERNHLGISSN